ncbi:oxidoreductase [Lelliottia wanjuensis]|uniref:oxidoreductase n=1 Tax=Lelliottia wanjuensis TaxID=3050585 RepID=UPI00254BB101|nr:oxidoreductase [Lelliottia sp. V86_10]MDK9585764.1 oxidoreductase [Lelliottia sp. V86_10]
MTQKGEFSFKPQDVNCEANINEFIFNTLMSRHSFVQLVIVKKVKAGPLLDVMPLVSGFSADGSRVDNSTVFNVPVWRLQRGASAVIMDPIEGDIGLMLCCDRDITKVRDEKKESLPASKRVHSKSDGIYLGGVLNAEPSQYVKFSNDGIDIVSPLLVNVNGNVVSINAESRAEINAPQILLNGQVGQGEGSYAGTAHFKNKVTSDVDFQAGDISLVGHRTSGVQTGGGTSGTPVP